ncbi:uncharacterized protein LOC115961727 [Quercus lobata]|uniref:uncharacterized protein LOC115961727 n=1 Tax=Quercus lobata TaxID=97700 RepID=UPI00124845A4|nr:uncharacterized protein LOC115961727 [Quercus lobata]
MNKREESWRLLEELSTRSDLPWICIGDFNEIMHEREKEGGNIRPEWQMKNFREAVNQCNLRDIGYIGPNFTWCRRLGARGWIKERLDRALASTNWSVMFPNVGLHHVAASTSDHCMLVLKAHRDRQRRNRRKKLFRFESMWLRDEGFKEIVTEAWDRALNMRGQHPFSQCLEECRQSLTMWNRNTFGHVGKKIAKLQEKLQGLEGRKSSINVMEEIQETKIKLNRMLLVEEDMWQQRSRNSWLNSGDRNTSFFHTKASNKHQRNTISRIKDSNNVWQEDEEIMGRIFVEYFT